MAPHPLKREFDRFLRLARPPQLRSLRQFAEQEIVIPDGPFAGRRFRCDRQPYTALWLDALDSGRWNRCVATGPTQSGKTLCCFVIPLLYHLFEIGETVICGLPDMDMAGDKWRESLLPVIARSRYRTLLPRRGEGSRGGRVESLQFRNGATLKFMSGGGGDKSRAGFTSRVVVITETDGLDECGGQSRESDKITQLEARTRAYGQRKRVYLECTVSVEQGRTWREYQQGSRSRILLPCPHCQEWVAPERDHLVGWQAAASQLAAREQAHFTCPACAKLWSERERAAANRRARLVHAGQSIEGDQVVGPSPATETLGFRWSAVHNLFVTAGEVGADEWRAQRAANEEDAEREMRQFVWCLPALSLKWDQISLAAEEIIGRANEIPRGIVPARTQRLTAAIDLGKHWAHWIVVAWQAGATGHIVDYGRHEVASADLGVEPALLAMLAEFKQRILLGWPVARPDGTRLAPGQVWIDAGYMAPVVYAFCRQAGERFRPSIGRGATQQRAQWHNRPTQTGSIVKQIGEGFHANWLPTERLLLVEVDADHWKTWAHERLKTPLGNLGAMTLCQGAASDHLLLAKHLTAEVKTEEFIAGKGPVVKWERVQRQNHWLDALYNACAAGHAIGARLIGRALEPRAPAIVADLEELAPRGCREFRSAAAEPDDDWSSR